MIDARDSWLGPRSSIAVMALPLGAALSALVTLHLVAPAYLRHQGFPLDDAWIHAVYAREFARSGMLAYNPGIPATGETAPLWAIGLAAVHRAAPDVATMVAATKAVGFMLHAGSAVLLAAALRRISGPLPAAVAAALVAFHPDLVAASVSGMEVPLATLLAVGALAATLKESAISIALVGVLTVGVRPETAVVAAGLPFLFWIRTRPWRAVALSMAGAAGTLIGLVILSLRNHVVSGMYLPATFHAKVDSTSPFGLEWQIAGFNGLLGELPLVSSTLVLGVCALVSVWLLVRRATRLSGRMGAAMYLTGLVYCSTSFVLVHPLDPTAFYHLRYVLPALFLMAAALALLIVEAGAALPGRARAPVSAIVFAAIAAILATATPSRYVRLANDARNIDDVQVAMGRNLHAASESDSAWVIDAGATRFFGKPFVIDLIGLNTPEILRADAQTFLDAHPPRYLDRFEGWSEIQSTTLASMPVRSFVAATRYTVTNDLRMRKHDVISCEPTGATGRITVRGRRTFRFQCPS
jgi:hypothetical protein